ncbi:acrEF/envCD operon transcriptional regulator [Cronobacter dublinensis]|uniref:acrEF/envCD operon transcriptional regulator n=1 Tax=Cronobacter dublinensis TaxID=413497 RepID=UPI001D87A07E|nr:acrEF/envCD operon transcriptional regulator [Cronobacter dublinensis]EGT5660430.1 acrEF/envCD operon transcriptional regulator [Cronobacter dublinensis subsp. dublinensis]EGT5668247.1 acrEF/envCD operon transcriptional regulator [Cronobacter dublinensis subsp. dublinensis]EGT5672611.1 acrEF/envCD operon transcriptional regulator [Cronobacter dublinensis subsp. dublinensis]EGT5676298.1 acrEF/envCD operon transcriptional regulator [Cronobacter dublinensis subsp. dublinensis]EGT5685600.1 acrE
MARRTKQEALKTRQQLIDAAIFTFAERGVAHTTLADIARAAEVTRGAVYWHFTSKAELFNEIWQQQLPVRDIIRAQIPAQVWRDPLLLLRETFIAALQYIASTPRQRALLQILYRKCEFDDSMISEADIRERIGFSRHYVGELLRQGIAENKIAGSLDVDIMLTILHGCLSGILKNWLFQPDACDLFRLAPVLVDNMLRMLPRPENNDAAVLIAQ